MNAEASKDYEQRLAQAVADAIVKASAVDQGDGAKIAYLRAGEIVREEDRQ